LALLIVISLVNFLFGVLLCIRMNLPLLTIELYISRKTLSIRHFNAFLLMILLTDQLPSKSYKLATPSTPFVCSRFISWLENWMIWIERGYSFKTPVDVRHVLLVERKISLVAFLIKQLENDLEQNDFFWRIKTVQVYSDFVLLRTIFEPFSDIKQILHSYSCTGELGQDIAIFLASNIKFDFRKLLVQHYVRNSI
jgi:hypothetical protein